MPECQWVNTSKISEYSEITLCRGLRDLPYLTVSLLVLKLQILCSLNNCYGWKNSCVLLFQVKLVVTVERKIFIRARRTQIFRSSEFNMDIGFIEAGTQQKRAGLQTATDLMSENHSYPKKCHLSRSQTQVFLLLMCTILQDTNILHLLLLFYFFNGSQIISYRTLSLSGKSLLNLNRCIFLFSKNSFVPCQTHLFSAFCLYA